MKDLYCFKILLWVSKITSMNVLWFVLAFRIFPDVACDVPDSRCTSIHSSAAAAWAALGKRSTLQWSVLDAAWGTTQAVRRVCRRFSGNETCQWWCCITWWCPGSCVRWCYCVKEYNHPPMHQPKTWHAFHLISDVVNLFYCYFYIPLSFLRNFATACWLVLLLFVQV